MNVGFVGAFCTANFGDWAMLVNNIEDINPSKIVIFTYNSGFPHQAIEYYFPKKNCSFCEVKTLEVLTGNCQTLTPLECISNIRNTHEIKSKLQDIDILCVNGGGYFDDNWCSRFDKFNKIIAPILLAVQNGKKVVFMAQGIGPIIKLKEAMRFFFNYLPSDTIIGLRDDYCSASYLLELGVSTEQLVSMPDDLLILNDRFKRPANAHFLMYNPYVVLVVSETIEEMTEHKTEICGLIEDLKNKGLSVVAVPFDLNQYGEHQTLLLKKWHPEVLIVDFNEKRFIPIEFVYDIIANAYCVITTRYHAMVLAIQANVPFFIKVRPIQDSLSYYYNKYHGTLSKALGVIDEQHCFYCNWGTLRCGVAQLLETTPPLSLEKNVHKPEQNNHNILQLRLDRLQFIKYNFSEGKIRSDER